MYYVEQLRKRVDAVWNAAKFYLDISCFPVLPEELLDYTTRDQWSRFGEAIKAGLKTRSITMMRKYHTNYLSPQT